MNGPQDSVAVLLRRISAVAHDIRAVAISLKDGPQSARYEWARELDEAIASLQAQGGAVATVAHTEYSASRGEWRHTLWTAKEIPCGTKLYTHPAAPGAAAVGLSSDDLQWLIAQANGGIHREGMAIGALNVQDRFARLNTIKAALATPSAPDMRLPSRFQIGEAVMACGLRGVVEYVTFDHGQPVESSFDGETYIGAKVIYGVRTKIGLVKTISDGVSPMPQLSVVDS